jgi:hypothetical protein
MVSIPPITAQSIENTLYLRVGMAKEDMVDVPSNIVVCVCVRARASARRKT